VGKHYNSDEHYVKQRQKGGLAYYAK